MLINILYTSEHAYQDSMCRLICACACRICDAGWRRRACSKTGSLLGFQRVRPAWHSHICTGARLHIPLRLGPDTLEMPPGDALLFWGQAKLVPCQRLDFARNNIAQGKP